MSDIENKDKNENKIDNKDKIKPDNKKEILKDKSINLLKKYWSKKIISIPITIFVIILSIILIAINQVPHTLSKEEAAELYINKIEPMNQRSDQINTNIETLNVDALKENINSLINICEDTINTFKNASFPTEVNSDIQGFIKELEDKEWKLKGIINSSDNDIISKYQNISVSNNYASDIRKILNLPPPRENQKLTDKEIVQGLLNNALDIKIGKLEFVNECEYIICERGKLPITIKNKGKVDITKGGSIRISAIDKNGNDIMHEDIYFERLNKGQSITESKFDYISDDEMGRMKDNPKFEITKITLYSF
jgi:hypothetical protein